MSIDIRVNDTTNNNRNESLSTCSSHVVEKKENKNEVVYEKTSTEYQYSLPTVHDQIFENKGKIKEVCVKNYCDGSEGDGESCELNFSELFNWPVKLKVVPDSAPYLDGANLLIASDCSAFVHGRFHEEIMVDKVLLTTCPYYLDKSEKEALQRIFNNNNVVSVKIVEMGVACCSNLHTIVEEAVAFSGKNIVVENIRLTKDGNIIV